ncbi:MAG TPA: hypothetical protein VEY51_18640 [Chondromyces sp.]|nr:hypothetical protein [Chondromyces sp.]
MITIKLLSVALFIAWTAPLATSEFAIVKASLGLPNKSLKKSMTYWAPN